MQLQASINFFFFHIIILNLILFFFYHNNNYNDYSFGSGKSAILYAILGEMRSNDNFSFSDMITINGVISIATQEPWII